MEQKPGTIFFDTSGYAIGMVWQTDNGDWRGKKITHPANHATALFEHEATAVAWMEKGLKEEPGK